MKKFFSLIPVSIFSFILLVGIIGLIIPFNFEKFSYDSPEPHANQTLNTYNVSFDIDNNSNETFNNVTITINYSTKILNSSKLNIFTYENSEIKINSYNLKEDENTVVFTHTAKNNKYCSFNKINSVKLTLDNGRTFEIYSSPAIFSGINWIFCGMIVVGFFGSAIFVAINISKNKQQEFEEKDNTSFNERVRKAFLPIADTINTLRQTYNESKHNIENPEPKPKKVTCPYCKGKYSSTEDKCPHCGAPPEPCD